MSISSSPFIAGAVIAALGGMALAQEPAAQPPAPPAEAAPAEAAPAEAAPAVPAEAAPAPQAAVAPPEPPPTLPTTGDGATVVSLLSKVCRPMVEGKGTLDQLGKANGLKKDNKTGAYSMALAQKPYQVEVLPSGSNNKNVCEMRIRYAPGWDEPIVDAMNKWRFLHDPQLRLKRNDIGAYTDAQRTTTTWDNWENQGYDGKMIGLILVQLNNPDGTAINKNFDEAIIQYSQRAALPPEQAQAPLAAQQPAAPAQPAG